MQAEFDQDMPRRGVDRVERREEPFLVAGGLRGDRAMDGMHEVAHPAYLVLGLFERPAIVAFRVDRDSRETVAYFGERHRVVILGDQKRVVNREVRRKFVIEIGIAAQGLRLARHLHAPFVEADKLFMEMVERRARGFEPVLEHADIAHERVLTVDIEERIDREKEVLVVLVWGEFP